MNQLQRFCYEVTSKQSLEVLLERKRLSHKDLIQLLKGIRRALAGAREYLLDVNRLLLSPEYIYMNLDQGVPELCYYPYLEHPIRDQFFDLAEYLLGKLDRQDRAGVELGYEIYKMAGEENCSLEEILHSEIARSEVRPAAAEKVRLFREPSEPKGVLRVAEAAPAYGNETQRKSFWGRKRKESILRLQEEKEQEVFLEQEKKEETGTRLLSESTQRNMILYGMRADSPRFVIRNDSFLIGKKRDAVDGYIEDHTVSRIHARIEQREQEYYLVDLNSTNGTYINGRLLGVNESVKLHTGDTIRFAEVEYMVGLL